MDECCIRKRFKQDVIDLANQELYQKFYNNPFEYACDVCSRLWFKLDLKKINIKYAPVIQDAFQDINVKEIFIMCYMSLINSKTTKGTSFIDNKWIYVSSKARKSSYIGPYQRKINITKINIYANKTS